MGYIKHNDKKYTSILLKFSQTTEFSRILDELHNLFFHGVDEKILENIRYSLLELVNNSIRAHKERDEKRAIELRFKIEDEELRISLLDRGGGFDKSKLPYNLDQDVQDIDINNQSFLNYREKNGYMRFGMGLLISKRTFDGFTLRFHNNDGTFSPEYDQGKTVGTLIELRSHLII